MCVWVGLWKAHQKTIAINKPCQMFATHFVKEGTYDKLPDVDLTIAACTRYPTQTRAIDGRRSWTPANGINTPLMTLQNKYTSPFIFLHLFPNPHRTILTPARQIRSIRGKGDTPYGAGMSSKSGEAVPIVVWVVYVELYGVVVGGACEDFAGGVPSDGFYVLSVFH